MLTSIMVREFGLPAAAIQRLRSGCWRAEAPADLTLHHLRAFSNSSERQSTRCFRIPGGQVNLGVPNLSLSFFGEDNRWNRFTEG